MIAQKYIYAITGALLVILITLLILLNYKMTLSHKSLKNQPSPTLQKLPLSPTTVSTDKNMSAALPFTGVADISFTPEEELQIEQERNLRLRSPFENSIFQISYNYATYNFEVRLKEPIEVSREQFASWLHNTYPKISLTRFIIIK